MPTHTTLTEHPAQQRRVCSTSQHATVAAAAVIAVGVKRRERRRVERVERAAALAAALSAAATAATTAACRQARERRKAPHVGRRVDDEQHAVDAAVGAGDDEQAARLCVKAAAAERRRDPAAPRLGQRRDRGRRARARAHGDHRDCCCTLLVL